jgi:hypothetical protein
LEKELASKGAPTDFVKLGQKHSPLEALVNGGASGRQFTDVLLDYLPKVDASSKEMIARALTIKGNSKATKPLLNLFRDTTLSDTNRWAVGNALGVINDKNSYADIISICKETFFNFCNLGRLQFQAGRFPNALPNAKLWPLCENIYYKTLNR